MNLIRISNLLLHFPYCIRMTSHLTGGLKLWETVPPFPVQVGMRPNDFPLFGIHLGQIDFFQYSEYCRIQFSIFLSLYIYDHST